MTNLTAANSTTKLRFGLWFEPEMVSPNSTLYHEHPDWVLSAGPYPRTERRSQLVLDVSRADVQDFIIASVSDILTSSSSAGGSSISYVKWDANRGMHELPSPGADHAYLLGLYRVLDALTSRFPDVLWEGCASGGGRLDPGVLHYFPQVWASDNTDALARLSIQFGSSLVYPPSVMGAHVSAVPNAQTGRSIPVEFRAHVAMMAGSFGLELGKCLLVPLSSLSRPLLSDKIPPPPPQTRPPSPPQTTQRCQASSPSRSAWPRSSSAATCGGSPCPRSPTGPRRCSSPRAARAGSSFTSRCGPSGTRLCRTCACRGSTRRRGTASTTGAAATAAT